MSSPAEGLLNREQLDFYLQSDESLRTEFNKLISKTRPQSFPCCSSDNKPDALGKISEYAVTLFNIVRFHAANGNVEFKFNGSCQSAEEVYFGLPSAMDPLFGKATIAKLMQQIFANNLEIKLEAKGNEWIFSWSEGNPFLPFKPVYEPQCNLNLVQKAYFIHLFEHSHDYDVSFLVEDKVVNAHRIFLKQSPFFTTMFEHEWKEKHAKEPIPILEYNHDAFKAMIFYFYAYEIVESDAKNAKLILELYKLSYFIQYKPLIEYCRLLLGELISERTFLLFAFVQDNYEDEYLLKLCHWFVRKNYDYGKKLEISHFTTEQLFRTYRVIRKYDAKEYNLLCLTLLKDRLELEHTIEQLVELLSNLADDELVAWYRHCVDNLEKQKPPLEGA